GIATSAPTAVLASPSLGAVCGKLVQRARTHFGEADAIMARSNRRTVRAARFHLMTRTVHVIGAGLAGLAAAVKLAARGEGVALHEAAGQAGGRCRSYHDPALDMVIDN